MRGVLNKSNSSLAKKSSCPFAKHCFNDNSVCGHIGYYAECPQTLKDRILVEIKEGGYGGVTPYTLLRRVRIDGKVRMG